MKVAFKKLVENIQTAAYNSASMVIDIYDAVSQEASKFWGSTIKRSSSYFCCSLFFFRKLGGGDGIELIKSLWKTINIFCSHASNTLTSRSKGQRGRDRVAEIPALRRWFILQPQAILTPGLGQRFCLIMRANCYPIRKTIGEIAICLTLGTYLLLR